MKSKSKRSRTSGGEAPSKAGTRRGQENKADGEHGNADEVALELSPGESPCGRVKQWRKEDEKDQVWIQADARHAGYEAQDESSDDEQDWIGHFELSGEASEHDHEDEEQKENTLFGLYSGTRHRV